LKGKNSQSPKMKHLDETPAHVASANDMTGLIPAKRKKR
jgi:hypothetical protein